MAYIINGVLDSGEWKLATRLNAAGTSPTGYDIYGTIDGNAFVFALQSAVNISFNTTVWLNTDHATTTGYPIFEGLNAGADFNITFIAGSTGTAAPYLYTGASPLYTEAAAQASIAAITDYAFSADLKTVEFRVPLSALGLSGAPAVTDVYADINNSVFLPQDYTLPTYKVVDPATLPAPTDAGLKVGIVYSETSAAKFFDKTAYSDLFMAAQNQAAMAGVPFDLLTEADLTNLANLASYDTLIFPSFANVPRAKFAAIQDTLTTTTQQYGVGIVAAGSFMTNDETGAALPGDSYARMKALLGVQLEGWTGANAAVHVAAHDVSHAVMQGYTAGETIRDYAAIGTQWFTAAVGSNATVLADQVVGGQAHNAVLATEAGSRNVHFATEGLLADNNMLAHALDWTARDAGEPVLKLQMSRQSALFASRNDLDEAMQLDEVHPETGPGIYDKLLPILDGWKAAYNFVGSYYIDIGDGTNGTSTDWAASKAYYQHLLAAGNEIGSHSMTHPEDTNLLTDAQLQYQFQTSKQLIEQNLGITVQGAAIPGAPEKMAVSEKVLQYYSYLSGGNAMVGAGYPGAFGYLTPDQTKVYLAPNISSDFTLIGWKQMTAAQATAAWQQEWKEMTAHAELPVIVFPWHDYGITGLDDPDYNEQMFTSLIQTAYQAGSEFVTLADLAQRINAFEKSGLTFSMVDADTISATVGSTGLLGTFALDLDGGQKIKSVAGWYAYDDDSVFLPSAGGTFAIDLGATPDDVTHITALPSRAELLSATSPGGGGLDFSVKGEGKLVIDLAN
ncbi:MAG TPA: polysaccharide deacetylase family protein, partial [Thermoanaerobaculia bacterium]|nr:polysaccharide deacetylase family protein [Thermoanaerobaculia bacterium]